MVGTFFGGEFAGDVRPGNRGICGPKDVGGAFERADWPMIAGADRKIKKAEIYVGLREIKFLVPYFVVPGAAPAPAVGFTISSNSTSKISVEFGGIPRLPGSP